MNRTISIGLLGLFILTVMSCKKDISEVAKKDTLFTALSDSGIDFTNTITIKTILIFSLIEIFIMVVVLQFPI